MFFIKSKAFHCLLACANRPSKLKCSFWFVLVYSCFFVGGFHWNFANFSSYKTFSACRSWRFCNSKQWSGFRKSNRYSTKWHKLRNSRVEYFCCGSIVSDLKWREENLNVNLYSKSTYTFKNIKLMTLNWTIRKNIDLREHRILMPRKILIRIHAFITSASFWSL